MKRHPNKLTTVVPVNRGDFPNILGVYMEIRYLLTDPSAPPMATNKSSLITQVEFQADK